MTTDALPFGPHLYGAKLHINAERLFHNTTIPVVIDVETDESDNFVGFAFTQDGQNIYYSTSLPVGFKDSSYKFVGHNLKGDLKWLKNWGVDIKPEQLFYDTCLASYVQNTTKESHGLKDLAKEYLGMEWPSYKDMVGKGKGKLTLDKQPVERVAAYCGLDCLATFRLYQHFQKVLTPQQRRYLETIELPTARVLLEMELKGAAVDVPYLKQIDVQFRSEMDDLKRQIKTIADATEWKKWVETKQKKIGEFNSNSGFHIAAILQAQGAVLPRTKKGRLKTDKNTLGKWLHLPVVKLLQQYSEIETLQGTFTSSILEKHRDGRVYAKFNQITKDDDGNDVGISTSRLSSSEPNLQNIPSRTEKGSLLRKVFIGSEGRILIDPDFSQIEPRLVAHFSKDPLFLRTFREDRDIYSELVEGTGRDRQDGKTFMLALLYGAQPKKLASVFKCSEQEAQEIINRIMRKLPGVTAWLNRTKYEARQKKGIWTLFKRWIPLPGISSSNPYERMHWERAAVNYTIQGSAAEIMKLGLIKLTEAGHGPLLTVHDEYLIETDAIQAVEQASKIKEILENIVKLDVPLKVDVGIGPNWERAKENSK